MAEDKSSKRNNSTEDKESLVQSINVDTRYITDNRLQRRKKEKEEKKREEEKKDDEITVYNFNNGKCPYTDVTRGMTETKPVIDLSVIYSQLIEQEKSNSSNIENTPPTLCTTSANVLNHSSISVETNSESREIFSAQQKEFLSMLVDLPTNVDNNRSMEISSEELGQQNTGHFCSDTVFNLSKKVLPDAEIKVQEKGLDYTPIQNKISEPELRSDFEHFCRQMRLKWFFRNEPTPSFSETPAFKTKSSWNPPKGHPCLEVYLSQEEKELFELAVSHLGYSNFTKEEWTAIRSLADDRSIIIKKVDKGSCVVVWDRNDCIAEAEKQLVDKNIYQDVNFSGRILRDLVDKSNKMFRSLKPQGKKNSSTLHMNIRKLLI